MNNRRKSWRMMALASVQKAFSHCHLRIRSVLQMKVLIRTCCWMCHPTAPSLRQNSSYQQQVLQLKQAQAVAPYTRTSSTPRNTTLSHLAFFCLQRIHNLIWPNHITVSAYHIPNIESSAKGFRWIAFCFFAGNLIFNEIFGFSGWILCLFFILLYRLTNCTIQLKMQRW